MSIINVHGRYSTGCGCTDVTCMIDIEKNKYELKYSSKWMGSKKIERIITGDVSYCDFDNDKMQLHAYLAYTIDTRTRSTYPYVLFEIISFPKLREQIEGTYVCDKFIAGQTSDEYNDNGIILARPTILYAMDKNKDDNDINDVVSGLKNLNCTITFDTSLNRTYDQDGEND